MKILPEGGLTLNKRQAEPAPLPEPHLSDRSSRNSRSMSGGRKV